MTPPPLKSPLLHYIEEIVKTFNSYRFRNTLGFCPNHEIPPPEPLRHCYGILKTRHKTPKNVKDSSYPNRLQFGPHIVPNQTIFPPPVITGESNIQNHNSHQTVNTHHTGQAPNPHAQHVSVNETPPRRNNDEDSQCETSNNNEHTSDRSINLDCNEGQATRQQTDDVFIGVRRERRKRFFRYYVSNIDESSTRGGILAHFSNNGVQIHELQLFRSRNNKCYARIVVESQYKNLVESKEFPWPDNVYCTYWNRNQRRENNRRNKGRENNDADRDRNDKRDGGAYRRTA